MSAEQRLTIYKNFTFEASHILPKHPGQCSRLHGHSWKLTVGVSGPVNPETGFVVDYGELSELVKAYIICVVDHQHLGQGGVWIDNGDKFQGDQFQQGSGAAGLLGQDFYPSSENLVNAFVKILQPVVETLANAQATPATIQLEEVSLDETCTSKATWRRREND